MKYLNRVSHLPFNTINIAKCHFILTPFLKCFMQINLLGPRANISGHTSMSVWLSFFPSMCLCVCVWGVCVCGVCVCVMCPSLCVCDTSVSMCVYAFVCVVSVSMCVLCLSLCVCMRLCVCVCLCWCRCGWVCLSMSVCLSDSVWVCL